jgi:hypothetical protein
VRHGWGTTTASIVDIANGVPLVRKSIVAALESAGTDNSLNRDSICQSSSLVSGNNCSDSGVSGDGTSNNVRQMTLSQGACSQESIDLTGGDDEFAELLSDLEHFING